MTLNQLINALTEVTKELDGDHVGVVAECPETEGGWSIEAVKVFTAKHLSETKAVMLKIGKLVY